MIGSVCSGYGGLDMAVERVFGEPVAWFFEYESGPSKVLAHHWPDVPNYQDLTKADWPRVQRVRVMAGGTPCQDLSGAGRRRGMTEGTRSNLWVQMREGIATLRPEYVVWENVRGAYSARADSEVEREPGLLGATGKRPALRALGRVLGDLATLGYDARWMGVRAADVGAPHGRYRVFVVAQDAHFSTSGERRESAPGQAESGWARANAGGRSGASSSDSDRLGRDGWAEGSRRSPVRTSTEGDYATASDPSSPRRAGREDAGTGGGDAGQGARGAESERGGSERTEWGVYEPAVRRWESILGRPAPAATRGDGRAGAHRLSPDFVEWMMGLPAGHVTNPQIGLTRKEQLKALGNGVVVQQAEYAIRALLGATRGATSAP